MKVTVKTEFDVGDEMGIKIRGVRWRGLAHVSRWSTVYVNGRPVLETPKEILYDLETSGVCWVTFV